MKNTILLVILTCFIFKGISQKKMNIDKKILLKELAENGCKCVDSIETYNKTTLDISKEISRCIENQTEAYQFGSKLIEIDTSNNASIQKKINISINVNKNSDEYKKYYYEIERYMTDNCNSLKIKLAVADKQSDKSISNKQKALDLYSKGIDESKKEHYQQAIKYFKKAVKEDPSFAFAWDNLGLNYRRLKNYDKAIESYEKSLEIDPNGLMPLQNIAVVYQYKKEYQKAIETYLKLAKIDKKNPEIYYGIGQIYALNLKDNEKALDNLCKAYVIYIKQKSPYRVDAEKIIRIIYSEMKKQGKEDKFNEILKSNNITQN